MNDGELDRMLAQGSTNMPAALLEKVRTQIESDTKPVKPMRGGVYVLVFLAIFVLAGMLFTAMLGSSGWHALSVEQAGALFTALAVLGLTASALAARSMRPGSGPLYAWALMGLSLAVYEALVMSLYRDYSNKSFIELGWHCLRLGSVCGLMAMVPACLILRRGFVVEPMRAGAIAGLVGGLSGWLGLTLYCPLLTVPHAGVWHLAVVPVCVVAGALAGRLTVGR